MTPRTSPYTRGTAAVGLWVLAIVVATAVAWWAVAFVGGNREGSAGDVLSRNQVVTALEQRRAAPTTTAAPTPPPMVTPTPVPSPTPTPDPTPTTPEVTPPPVQVTPPPQDVVRTWAVDGGQVSASCRGTSIGLLYATASDGWTVETKSAGPLEVEVKLSRGEDETDVRAVCAAGIPTLAPDEAESHGGDEG